MASVKDTGRSIAAHSKQYMETLQHDQFPKFARFARTTARNVRIVAKGAAMGAKEAKRTLESKRELEEAGSHAADAAKGAVTKAGAAAQALTRSEKSGEGDAQAQAAEEQGPDRPQNGSAPRPGAGSQRSVGEALQGAAASAREELEKGRTNLREGAARTAEAAHDARETIKTQLVGESRGEGAQANPPAAGGYLGMTTFPVELPEKLSQAHGSHRGLIVLGVEPGGPADAAGIQLGDTLLSLDDDPLSEVQDLVAHLPPDRIGQEVHVKLVRAGTAQDLALTVGSKGPSGAAQRPSGWESEAHPG